jgi:hypothetical protein
MQSAFNGYLDIKEFMILQEKKSEDATHSSAKIPNDKQSSDPTLFSAMIPEDLKLDID